jgi:protein TonB
MSSARLSDDPWRRLPWLVPASLVIATLSLMGFLNLLTQFPDRPLLPKPVEVELVDLPAPAPPSPALATPPEPVVEPPPPDPPPLANEEPPPQPPPEPTVELKPPPNPPPPRPQRLMPQRPPPRQQSSRPAAPAAPQSEAPPTDPQPADPRPSVGGSIGARAIFQPMPQIPDALRQRRIDAVAIVVFHVAPDGSATVELREATDDPRLNQVLLEGFKRWRFFPALEKDNPVASVLELRVPIQVR